MIGFCFGLFFFEYMNEKIFFIPIILLASLLPDIDSAYSYLGREKVFRPLQFFVRHRGFIHSFTFAIVAAVLLAMFIPVVAFPFFLGYSLHLLADSLTVEGIRPFWPWKDEVSGKIRTGGIVEYGIFASFAIISLFFLISLFY